jgi:nucleotide-binding universal stress UspA family protein
VSGSLGSLHALRRAVADARLRDRAVWSVIAWAPNGGEFANTRAPSVSLLRRSRDAATQRMLTAWDEALGGIPADLTVRMVASRGTPGAELVQFAERPSDLLVVGSGTRTALSGVLTGRSVSRYCLARARCAVLTVPAAPLERELARLAQVQRCYPLNQLTRLIGCIHTHSPRPRSR